MSSVAEHLLLRMAGADAEETIRTASKMRDTVGGFAIGADLLLGRGPILVGALAGFGKPVLADLGILDRPSVVTRAVATMGRLGARWVSVSGLAGRRGVKAAVEETKRYPQTSIVVSAVQAGWASDEDLKGVGISDTPGSQVSRFTKLALRSGASAILFPVRELGVVAQVAENRTYSSLGNPGGLSAMAEVSGGLSCAGIATIIRSGAQWVVAAPEQVEKLQEEA